LFEQFTQIKLVKPFDRNLAKKKTALKQVKDGFDNILRYEIGETTAAATYYLAEMYYNFNRSLVESERPQDLVGDEKEQYELALEDQAYPFEEKAIEVHQKNLELITLGIYNAWIDKSFGKLAKLVPARYAKFEESSGFIKTFDRNAAFNKLTTPLPPIVSPPPIATAKAQEDRPLETQAAAMQPGSIEAPSEATATPAVAPEVPASTQPQASAQSVPQQKVALEKPADAGATPTGRRAPTPPAKRQ